MGFFKKITAIFSFDKKSEEDTPIPQPVNETEDVNETINITVQGLQNFAENRSNPQSCLSTPGEGMVRFACDDVDKYIKALCPETEDLLMETTQASLRGYNYIMFPKAKLDRIKQVLKEREETDALMFTVADLNNQGIELEKEGKIDEAIAVYEENCSLGYKAHHAYDRLIVLYHKRNDLENEARIIHRKIEVFGSDPKLERRLQKAEGTYVKPTSVMPTSRERCIVQGKPLGDKLEEIERSFPEFDFYNSGDEDRPNVSFYRLKNGEEMFEIRDVFKSWIEEAQEAEQEGDLPMAIYFYERLVANHYYLTTPYERLIILYKKAKLTDALVEVLNEAIEYFTALREKRREYVIMLAKKYGKLDFAMERINNGKKITYYGGAFELYNPFPKIEKWQEQLAKLKK